MYRLREALSAGAIEVKRKEGLYKFDPYSCVVCGACVEACPEKCLEVDSDWRRPVGEMKTEVWHIEPRRKKENRLRIWGTQPL